MSDCYDLGYLLGYLLDMALGTSLGVVPFLGCILSISYGNSKDEYLSFLFDVIRGVALGALV